METGEFGPIYRQFEKKPTEIIRGSLYEFVKIVIADKITRLHCMAKRYFLKQSATVIRAGVESVLLADLFPAKRISISSSLSKTSTLTVFVTCAVW